jgi:hypothetical protein
MAGRLDSVGVGGVFTIIGASFSPDGGVCGRLEVSSLVVCCEMRRRRSETVWRGSASLASPKSDLEAFD